MHAVVMDSLEGYLSGLLEPAVKREIEAHLGTCATCREEVRGMQEASRLFASLRSEDTFDPVPGLYGRIMQQVGEQNLTPSFAGLFSLSLDFGRRLTFASLVTLAVLSGYLISREAGYAAPPSPEAVMAQQDSPAFDSAPGHDNMLVTLTAYEH